MTKTWVLAAFAGVGMTGTAVLAQDLPACERYPEGEASYACQCGASAGVGSIWGTGVYTSDSDICTAAIHSGAITTAGGAVLAVARDGQDAYPASTANGVESRSWGAYGSSFAFDPKGPRFVTAGGTPECTRYDTTQASVRCSCPPVEASGSVWGSGPYTADSDLCTAATHAGVMDQMGGEITVMLFPGLEMYAGSQRNGVTTRDWGAYGDSIIINANE